VKKFISILLFTVFTFSLTGCQKEVDNVPELLNPVTVTFDSVKVEKGEIYNVTAYQGNVTPYVESLSFTKDGTLKEMRVVVGDRVEEGQILARLDDENLQEQIKDLEEQIEEITVSGEFDDRIAELDIRIAQLDYDKRLIYSTISELEPLEVEIRILKTKLEQSRETRELQLDKLNGELSDLKDQLNKLDIKAPFAGEVVYILTSAKGAGVEAYEPMICIADPERLFIVTDFIAVPTIEFADRITAHVLDTEYDISYLPYEDDEYIAMLLSNDNMSTRFSFDKISDEVESGQFALISLVTNYKDDAIVIPINSLYKDEGGHYVYLIADGKRERCNVKVGITTDIEAEILEGLQEGDVIYVKE